MSKELETIAREWLMEKPNMAISTLAGYQDEMIVLLAAFAAHVLSQQPPAGQVTHTELLRRIREAIHAGPVTNTGSRSGHVESLVIFGMVDQIDAALASAPRTNEDAGRWISVKDRLPKYPDVSRSMHDNKEYLVVVKSGTDRDKPLRMVAWYYGKDHGWSIANVTHWSELPPSPPTE